MGSDKNDHRMKLPLADPHLSYVSTYSKIEANCSNLLLPTADNGHFAVHSPSLPLRSGR